MEIAIVYIYPQVKPRLYFPLAQRFAETWKQHPPGLEHKLYVMTNGGEAKSIDLKPFDGIPCQFVPYNNLGWDIGAYQKSAETIPCDLLVCFGAPVHFYQGQWLELMVKAFLENGPGLYGCWAYLFPNWHVRTTAFWIPPMLLNSYPYVIGSARHSRYEFEHGNQSLTRHVLKAGFGCYMVSRLGCFPFSEWSNRGPTPEESLVLDQFTYDARFSNLRSR